MFTKKETLQPKRDEVKGSGEKYIMWSLMTCTPHPKMFG